MGYNGFDKESYPGKTAMQNFYNKPGTNFVYCGFYLPGAPNHSDTSFNAQARKDMADIGYGFIIYYVGRQMYSPASARTATQGAADARDAIAKAKDCGFTRGIIYLDIENVSPANDQTMVDYATGFMEEFEDTAFMGGIYCSASSASLFANVPYVTRLNVARYDNTLANTFSGLSAGGAKPNGSGVSNASTWQYSNQQSKTVGGSTLTIDLNVSDFADPSAT